MTALTVQRQLQAMTPRFATALSAPGVRVTADQLIMSIVTAVERTPQLLECNRQSLFLAAMSAAWLGLPCDGVTGQAFIIPFKKHAQLVVGYKGYNTLAARSGITLTGEVVRSGDEFDFDEGEGFVRHKKSLAPSDAPIVAAWAKAAANDRPPIVKVMALHELLTVKARSAGATRPESPWNDPSIGFPAMCEKTVKRRLARNLPLNVLTVAARMEDAHDEGAHAWITGENSLEVRPITDESPQPDTATLLAPPPSLDDHRKTLTTAAEHGMQALEEAWLTLPRCVKAALKPELDASYKPRAVAQDEVGHESPAP
jgi:recombination protein RecT